MGAQLIQNPGVFPANAFHHVAGAEFLGQHVERIGFDLEMGADPAAQLVEEFRREQNGGRAEHPSIREKERHMEMNTNLLDVPAPAAFTNRVRQVIPCTERSIFEQCFDLMQVNGFVELLQRFPRLRPSRRNERGTELDF